MPLGNAADISYRAAEILQNADIILAEDTRKARDWFSRCSLEVQGLIRSSHSYNEGKNTEYYVHDATENVRTIAVISDAGTPSISDPGKKLITAFQKADLCVLPVPGASALTTVLSVTPFRSSPALFMGFVSPKSQRRRNQLKEYDSFEGQMVLFESRHRVVSLMKDILKIWGDIEIFIGRDMTKTHEEYFYGQISEAIEHYQNPRGEFTLVLNKTKRNSNPELSAEK